MLQKYTFVDKLNVHELQVDIEEFFKKIKGVTTADSFDPDQYCSARFATIVKRKVIKKRKGVNTPVNNDLHKKLNAFFNKYKTLGPAKAIVDDCFEGMNKINALLNNTQIRYCLSDLPKSIQNETKSLFLHLYKNTLSTYGIKKHYESFCNEQQNRWCPFCGMEMLEDFSFIKEDYDHLLAKSIYPLAAVNMKNLAPMGKKCNRTHKKDQDLIWDGKTQTRAINPYSSKLDIEIDFTGTILPNGKSKKGTWKLKALPNKIEVDRWQEIFRINARITKDYFTGGKRPDIETWITDFTNRHDQDPNLTTLKKVRAALDKVGKEYENERFKEGRYVKASLFKWVSVNAPDTYIQALLDIIQRKKAA
jgi:hypothetical protein